MKVLCEIPLQVSNYQGSQFEWLTRNKTSCLFVVEAGKRLNIVAVKQESAEEVQSTALAESRICTSCSWNRDATLLAIVVDKRQVYLWQLNTNTFVHLKTQSSQVAGSSVGSASRKSRPRDVELVAWSKVSDKLAVCYASGQILLCKFASNANNVGQKFIDNSDSVLKGIVSVEVSNQADLFACFSIISEVLVMSFDGQTKFYVQGDGLNLFNAKFSNPMRELTSRNMSMGSSSSASAATKTITERAIWLAYQSKSDGLFLKKICLERTDFQDMKPKLDVLHDKQDHHSRLINFFWLSSTRLLACFSSGSVLVARLSMQPKSQLDSANIGLVCEETFCMGGEQLDSTDRHQEKTTDKQPDESGPKFKAFELVKSRGGQGRHTFALVAATDYKIFYYELHETDQQRWLVDGRPAVSFEQVDEVDLFESLSRISLRVERARWSEDCSMLAVQLTSGHILVYRTRLQINQVASCGPRTAYLSSANEITVLNFAPTRQTHESTTEQGTGENALMLNVGLKPSLIAIGPRHLALALNNRVRFYPINRPDTRQAGQMAPKFHEQEYATIVTGLKLNSKFVVIQFDDRRLKLEATDERMSSAGECDYDVHRQPGVDSANDERFFPDPARPEDISSFCLTEQLLLYCTGESTINVFSLVDWNLVQRCDHSDLFVGPIDRLVANEPGNKFVCLPDHWNEDQVALGDENVYLYDLYSNTMMSLNETEFFEQILKQQIEETLSVLTISAAYDDLGHDEQSNKCRRARRVVEAVWDADGRTLLLVERDCVHVLAVLDHSLEREEPTVAYAGKSAKPTSYTILFASQGIVSYQTSLGRVVNAILETHDDELKLCRLEAEIGHILSEVELQRKQPVQNHDDAVCQKSEMLVRAMLRIMYLKLAYLRSILPVYCLPKCHDICEHLMSEQQFNLRPSDEDLQQIELDEDERLNFHSNRRLIDQLLWKLLAAWSIHLLNLDFGLLVYRKHRLLCHSRLLTDILDDLRLNGQDSRQTIMSRLLLLLGFQSSSSGVEKITET